MSKYSKINVIGSLQKWMDSVAGQTFLNYAYSWGASVVILGALFKLTHLPSANLWLYLGMGTEVVVFFLSAFDRPFIRERETEPAAAASPQAPVTGYDMSAAFQEQQQLFLRKLEETKKAATLLPDGSEAAELKKTLIALNELYKRQLDRASTQVASTEQISNYLNRISCHLHELDQLSQRINNAIKSNT